MTHSCRRGGVIKFGRASPGKLTVSHVGDGSISHMSALVFLRRADITATVTVSKPIV